MIKTLYGKIQDATDREHSEMIVRTVSQANEKRISMEQKNLNLVYLQPPGTFSLGASLLSSLLAFANMLLRWNI